MRAFGEARGEQHVKRGLLLLLALACIVGFVRLGFWQLHRAEYKDALLAHSREILAARLALPLATEADALRADPNRDDYTWTSGNGRFLPVPAVVLDNQVRDGQPGVRVYRVFQPDGARRALLVELGWRPLQLHRQLLPEPALPGNWSLHGLMAPPPSAGLQLAMSGSGMQWQPDGTLLLMRLDAPQGIAAAYGLRQGLSSRVLRLDPAMKLGYARDLDVLGGSLPPEQHRGYAVQWFGMAAGLLVVTIVVARRKSKPFDTERS